MGDSFQCCSPSDTDKRQSYLYVFALSLVAAIVGSIAITHQSLWMDEGSSAFKALIPGFKDWLWMTFRIGGSDVQMPFYMTVLWIWHKLGFTSEYALRCINLPFLILMVLALKRVRYWPLICLTSPFVLYYVGELRPYTMQMAGGSLAALGLLRIIANKDQTTLTGLHTVACAALILTASSLSAAVWVAGLAIATFMIRPEWFSRRDFWLKSAPWLCGGILFAVYYSYTLFKGYRAASTGEGGLLSIGFGFYEMAGLLGIGPSRNEIRTSPTIIIHHLPWLIPAAACLFYTWFHGLRKWLSDADKRVAIAISSAVILPVFILISVSLLTGFQLLGRHMSPAIPVVLLPIAYGLASAFRRPSISMAAGIASILILLTSSLFLRFHSKHLRDDCRKASEIAIDALTHGKRVLWQADMNSIRYYAFRRGGFPYVNAIQQLESDPPGLLFADLVVINRPDLRFRGKEYRKELQRNDFVLQESFTGFEIWQSSQSTPSR